MSQFKVSIDGEIVDENEAQVSVFDRGFLYGDSVFEVFRTYHRVPFGMRPHLARLERSAERLLIPMPVGTNVLAAEIEALIAASAKGDRYIRLILTRGTGPLTYDLLTASNPLRVIVSGPLRKLPDESYQKGIAAILLEASRPTDDARASGAKASNYLANLLAVHEAKRSGADEAFLLGRRGQVLEGATSNIFTVKDGRLFTSCGEPGILMGITRGFVFDLAKELGIEICEIELTPKMLYEADEVFITSSLREVMSVVLVDGHTIGSGVPGSIAHSLRRAYLEMVTKATDASI